MSSPNRETKRLQNQRYYQLHVKPQRAAQRANGPSPRLAKDDKKILVTIRLPVQLVGRVEKTLNEAVATKRYPFRTKTALYTYLILHGFDHLRDDPFIAEMLPYLEAIEAVGAWRFHRTEAAAAFSQIATEINELLRYRLREPAVQCYHVAYDAIMEMPPSVWREWLLSKLERSYSVLHKAVPQAVPLGTAKKAGGS